MSTAPALPADYAPLEEFLAQVERGLADGTLVRLVLSKPHGSDATLKRVTLRPVVLRGETALSFVYAHETRDITRNAGLVEGLQTLRGLIGSDFRQANLLGGSEDCQLLVSKKGKQTLLRSAAERDEADASHDREKQRWLSLAQPFLSALGVTTAEHQLVPAMSRKWKQINKFVEVLAHALDASPLADAKAISVADFGAGKGYLTFAVHDYLQNVRQVRPAVTGVELRPDLVGLCSGVVDTLGLQGLRFEEGDVRTHVPGALNVMIALHACDTATDHAIHLGLAAGADIILCSPCCHKQIRPQLLSPHPLRPILQHGVHLGQEAEMLTDGLRALLLDASGYDTQVFEFISLEHTNKNKMILAVKRSVPKANDEVKAQIAEIKAFYGIREHALESLLRGDGRL